MDPKNTFEEKYSSKISPFYIPLPEFKFHHGASSEEKVDSKFIGRENIIERLKSWLISEETKTGVYLVTGFRGMGKSSFVGKVLSEITKKTPIKGDDKLKRKCLYLCLVFVSVFIAISCFLKLLYIEGIIFTLISIYCYLQVRKNKEKKDDEKKNRIPIKLNLGHEILNERDILSLVSNSIEYEYEKYLSNFSINRIYFYRKWVIIGIVTSLLSCITLIGLFDFINESSGPFGNSALIYLIESINGILVSIKKSVVASIFNLLLIICVSVSIFFVVYSLWKLCERIYAKYNPLYPRAILKKLTELNLRIVSATNEDVNPTGAYSPSMFGITINRRKNRHYPIADVREIEQRLSWILNEIDKSNKDAPKFIIVFDELDKIDPALNHSIDDKTDTIPAFENTGSGFAGGATSRKRKQNLLKLLANMKYFISTAKVKFVFIAGRELYDAYLADSSDREFAIGSIFNNVIYVNSFLWTTEPVQKDITLMTEMFICKQILPEYESEGKEIATEYDLGCNNEYDYYTLRTYNRILEEMGKKNEEKKIDNTQRRYIIMTLYQFAVYLSHISNGAPKKISNYFEQYIISDEQFDKKEQKLTNKLYIESKKEWKGKYYLAFTYKAQQKIGFIHYLAFPVVNAILNNASRYGDKLLISGCFLTNHIYKYHNSGFSWRNLENVPELLDINKSPETREFIETIVAYLKRSHISTTINSLYHFKFPMRIAEEISIMSRLSEEVSALFNFTLDDSLSLKRHYSKLLDYYNGLQNNAEKNTNSTILSTPQNDFHHVIAGIHHILGDLHALDEEYNEAIFEYQCAISILLRNYRDKEDTKNNNNPHYPSHVLNAMRIMLKLSLTFEKRKTYDSAYTTYNELISLLIKFRYIDPEELGLSYKQKIKKSATWKDRDDIIFKKDEFFYYDSTFEKKVQPEIEEFDSDIDYRVNAEELIPQLHTQLSPEKNTLAFRLSMFEDISLIYQALLARLFVLEKKGLSGISKENIDIIESDFLYLQRAVYYQEKFMIAADFFRKLADILYYKNGLINTSSCSFYMSLYFYDYNMDKDIYEYFLKNKCSEEKHDEIVKILKEMPLELKEMPLELKEMPLEKKDVKYQWEIKNKKESPINDSIKKSIINFITSENVKKRMESKGISIVNEKDNIFISETDENRSVKKIYGCNNLRKKLLEGYNIYVCSQCGKISIKEPKQCPVCKKPDTYKKVNVKDKRVPCYACKFYNRSLKIIKVHMMQSPEEECPGSKAISFIEQFDKREEFKSLKENDILTLAASLDGLGNTMFSCSDYNNYIGIKKVKIEDKKQTFMNFFIELIRKEDKTIPVKRTDVCEKLKKLRLSHLERAILYFWAAAEYYNYSANMKEAFFCYKKILHVFEAYLETHKTEKKIINSIKGYLEGIKEHLIGRAIQNLYTQYEYTNMTEVHKLKWIFSKEVHEDIPLNLLSSFPDFEEIIILYCRLELLCGDYKMAPLMYNSMPLSPHRIETTLTERIISLRFKADVNMRILFQLLGLGNAIYKPDFPQKIYLGYFSYLRQPLSQKLKDYYCFLLKEDKVTLKTNKNNPQEINSTGEFNDLELKIELIEFLITDTMFGLSKIIETISPTTPTTLFSESYMGNVYTQLFEVNQIFDFVFYMYKWCDLQNITTQEGKDEKEKKLINKIINFYKNRKGRIKEEKMKKHIEVILFPKINSKINLEIQNRKNSIEKTEKNDYSKIFTNWATKYIDKADLHNNQTNYLLEMAYRKYRRAIEMHHEGGAYQELIANMYYLEDNLSNNTFQFYSAIERYHNNSGVLNRHIEELRRILNVSSLSKMDMYIRKRET